LKIYISQAIVTTQLRCGCGIFSNHFIINFTQNVQVKKIWKKRLLFGEDMDKNLRLTFLTNP